MSEEAQQSSRLLQILKRVHISGKIRRVVVKGSQLTKWGKIVYANQVSRAKQEQKGR